MGNRVAWLASGVGVAVVAAVLALAAGGAGGPQVCKMPLVATGPLPGCS